MTHRVEIEAAIAQQFPGAKLRAAERLTGGVSADVYRLDLVLQDASEHKVVLRVHGAHHSGHDPDTEFQLLVSAQNGGLPVPHPICVDTSGRNLKNSYLLMGFVDGTTSIAETAIDSSIGAMADTLAAVHAIARHDLPTLPARRDPLPELLAYLPAGADWGPLSDQLSRLNEAAYQDDDAFLHGDFWPGNLIWQDADIAAIIDWEDAALGDPLSDVASTCLELRYLYGQRGAARFQDAYATHRAVDARRFALWQIYVAAAAQHFMGAWRLEPAREAHMRQTALMSMREASAVL